MGEDGDQHMAADPGSLILTAGRQSQVDLLLLLLLSGQHVLGTLPSS